MTAAARALPELPVYPADGGTECLSACRCYWSITDDEDNVYYTYVAQEDGRVCDDCAERERLYTNIVQPKGSQ